MHGTNVNMTLHKCLISFLNTQLWIFKPGAVVFHDGQPFHNYFIFIDLYKMATPSYLKIYIENVHTSITLFTYNITY